MMVFYTGALLKRQVRAGGRLGEACELLSGFVLLSGIWMLTDSRALCFFENPQDAYGVVFVYSISPVMRPGRGLTCAPGSAIMFALP